MNRRGLVRYTASGFVVLAATTLTSLARAQQSIAVTSAKQTDYLFWLPERDRILARNSAAQVLAELDGTPLDVRRISGIYQRGFPVLRKRLTEATFVSRLMKFRDGLGIPRERVLQSVEGGFKFLPNYPDGQYTIVTFDTIFSSTSIIYTEQLTFGRDTTVQSEQWQFVDYYLATKPFYSY